MRIYCVEREGRLVAALPLMSAPFVPGLRRWCSIFNHYANRSDALVDRDTPEALPELFRGILEARRDWDLIELQWIPEDSECFGVLARGEVAGLHVYATRIGESPFLPLEGDFQTWYQGQFSAKTRSRDRASVREARGMAGFALAEHRESALVDTLLDLEALGWKGEEGVSMKQDPRARRFMHDFAARLAGRGALSICLLSLEGRPAAFVLGFVERGVFYYFKTSYHPKYQELRPGRIVTNQSIEDAYARKLSRYDFLGASDQYKLRYTPHLRAHAAVFLFHDGVRSRLQRITKRRAVPLAKALLGRSNRYAVRVDR